MAEPEIRFVRKLSGEEAQKRYILIPKESLGLFPKIGLPFKLMIEGQTVETAVRPHEVRQPGSRKGVIEHRIDLAKHLTLYNPRYEQTVIIEKKNDHYSLRLS